MIKVADRQIKIVAQEARRQLAADVAEADEPDLHDEALSRCPAAHAAFCY
jgi:hypothetical protein